MLLRRYNISPRQRIGIGQLCLAAGIVLSRLSSHLGESAATGSAEPGFSAVDFGSGLMIGFGGALIGVSIVFNLSGLHAWRREKREGSRGDQT